MKEYVLGFAFDIKKPNVVLIEKEKPEWQNGFLNGVGGKIESYDETIFSAMEREFKEETGVGSWNVWKHFATLTFDNDILGGAKVYCFKVFNDIIYQCKTMESEEIKIINVLDLNNKKCIRHIKTLIPMAMDDSIDFCELKMN